jgi:hypothetical protein
MDWKNQWQDSSAISHLDYISFNIHPEDVEILRSLFFPKLIEVDDYLFLELKYQPENIADWENAVGGDRISVEKLVNHMHIYDIFAHCKDEVHETIFTSVGYLLQFVWIKHFKETFPDREIAVELINDSSDYGPTLYIFQK